VDFHHFLHHDLAGRQLDRIERKLDTLLNLRRTDMAVWTDIIDKIAEQTTLLGGFGAAIEALKANLLSQGVPAAAIDAAFVGLEANSTALKAAAAALVVNTPAEDVPIDQPPPA
jgi:hypothetical protein